jgi:hypothetical protein
MLFNGNPIGGELTVDAGEAILCTGWIQCIFELFIIQVLNLK